MDDPKPAPEPLYTPEFAAKRRRSVFWSMVMCVMMGAALVAAAIFSRDQDGMVTSGLGGGRFNYPWWLVAPAGLGLIALGLWGLWGHVTRRD
jgi:uncharacterized membrane protein YhaH (DUF805 family)